MTPLLGALLAVFVVLVSGPPAHAAKPAKRAPACPP